MTRSPLYLCACDIARATSADLKLRSTLLMSAGIPSQTIETPLPKGVGRDDWIDALAALVIARRRVRGEVVSFPSPPRSMDRKFRSPFGRNHGSSSAAELTVTD
jgi:Protein of unknown function (DUF429)